MFRIILLAIIAATVHAAFWVAIAYVLSLKLDFWWVATLACVVIGAFGESLATVFFLDRDGVADATEMPSDKTVERVAQLCGIIILCGLLGALVLLPDGTRDGPPAQHEALWGHFAGGVALALGFALRLWAITTLGKDFRTQLVAPSRWINRGPYRWIDHPGEIGMGMIAISGPIAIGVVGPAIVVAVMIVPLIVWRCRQENVLRLQSQQPSSADVDA